ncbi:flagellar biosynthetic protein FliO [Microbulbifer celer]|uniref:Flagellar protein n=1 Tax=Microbulbifer celer TaxID=435905 RepID=A0ABW3U3S8_9GAMM|nr:flagellar biosynthetic protein FliO [Microbulbifer celer]UFN57833.1 flagellar biosynthetic protein FliO [Microbulbifer celer]
MNNTSAASGESVVGLAMLGKVAGVLIALIALILLCAWLTRRLAPGLGANASGPPMRVVASKAVGTREKVVVLEVQDQWLVLGVGGGQVNHLHTLPAEPDSGDSADRNTSAPLTGSFANRLTQALRHNMGRRGDRS